MSATGVLVSSLFIALIAVDASSGRLAESASPQANETVLEPQMLPMMDSLLASMVPINDPRRMLTGGFKLCALCACCGRNNYCLPSPCCYTINCNIPNKPFGSCAFSPTTCNCFGCHT